MLLPEVMEVSYASRVYSNLFIMLVFQEFSKGIDPHRYSIWMLHRLIKLVGLSYESLKVSLSK